MLDQEWVQPVAVVNYPGNDTKYTRITEYKHLTGQRHPRTSITYEFPCWNKDPFYPVPNSANALLYSRYNDLGQRTPKVTLSGGSELIVIITWTK
ncbi:MAG TPA: UDP-galactopyranose mutase [Ohtaekwangia sp.]|nr:UDP-galactopyranose mutase [Ohtaekwangia sp.]